MADGDGGQPTGRPAEDRHSAALNSSTTPHTRLRSAPRSCRRLGASPASRPSPGKDGFGRASACPDSAGYRFSPLAATSPAPQPGARPPAWRPNGLSVETASGDHPGDDRVRVPHLPRADLVATPDEPRHMRDDGEDVPRDALVLRESLRAVHSLGDVRDVTAAPDPDLIAEQAEWSRPAVAHRTLSDHAPIGPAQVGFGRLLDDVPSLGQLDLEGGVVELAARAALDPCLDPLVHAPVVLHESGRRRRAAASRGRPQPHR